MAKQTEAPSKTFAAILRQHRDTLDRLLDRRSVVALKRFYDRAQDTLERKLSKLITEGRKDTMTAMQAQQLLVQVLEAQRIIAEQMASQFAPVLREGMKEGVLQVDRSLVVLERQFTGASLSLPLTEAATFEGIIEKRMPSLIAANASSFKRYGAVVTKAIQSELAVSLASGETPIEAIDRIRATADLNWWQSERIVRTEMAYAYNSAHADSIEAAHQDLRDLGKRWCELVSDTTGLPLDNRVAPDSLVLHGQVTTATGVFVMPPDQRVSATVWNKTFRSSPNRPNDRSVTMPWRPHWGIPGWEWREGQKMPIAPSAETLESLRERARLALAGG